MYISHKIIKPLKLIDIISIRNHNNDDIIILGDYLNEDVIGMNDIYIPNKHILSINTNITYQYVFYSLDYKNKHYNIYGLMINNIIYNLLYVITDMTRNNIMNNTNIYIDINALDELYRINLFNGYYNNTLLSLLNIYINSLHTENAIYLYRKLNSENDIVLLKLNVMFKQFEIIQYLYSTFEKDKLFNYLNNFIITLDIPKRYLKFKFRNFVPNKYFVDLISNTTMSDNFNINIIKKSFNINLYKILYTLFSLDISSFSVELHKGTKLIINNISYSKNIKLSLLFNDSDFLINLFKTIYYYLDNEHNSFPNIIYFDLINKFEFIIRYNDISIYFSMFFLMILSAPLSLEK